MRNYRFKFTIALGIGAICGMLWTPVKLVHAENIRIENGEIYFDFISPLGNIKGIQLGVPVYVNIENGIAAMTLAQIGGATNEEIKQAMPGFRGVDRNS